MSPLTRFHRNFIPERTIANAYLPIQVIALYTAIQQLPDSRFFVTFYTVRVVFLLTAWGFSLVCRSPRFYCASLSEMPTAVYWRFVILIMVIMKGIFLHKFVELPAAIQLIDLSFVTAITVILLMSYQGQVWTANEKLNRSKRIAILAKKAELSHKELEAITPLLIAEAAKRQRPPLFWRLAKVGLVVIWGATLSAYASALADKLSVLIRFNNLLPPF